MTWRPFSWLFLRVPRSHLMDLALCFRPYTLATKGCTFPDSAAYISKWPRYSTVCNKGFEIIWAGASDEPNVASGSVSMDKTTQSSPDSDICGWACSCKEFYVISTWRGRPCQRADVPSPKSERNLGEFPTTSQRRLQSAKIWDGNSRHASESSFRGWSWPCVATPCSRDWIDRWTANSIY